MQEMPLKSQPISHWHDHINSVSGEHQIMNFCHRIEVLVTCLVWDSE